MGCPPCPSNESNRGLSKFLRQNHHGLSHHPSSNCTMSDAPPAAPAAGEAPQGEAPSKNALKKAQKEKEKVPIVV